MHNNVWICPAVLQIHILVFRTQGLRALLKSTTVKVFHCFLPHFLSHFPTSPVIEASYFGSNCTSTTFRLHPLWLQIVLLLLPAGSLICFSKTKKQQGDSQDLFKCNAQKRTKDKVNVIWNKEKTQQERKLIKQGHTSIIHKCTPPPQKQERKPFNLRTSLSSS